MNKIAMLFISLFASLFCCGQNVGVGTITPTEKLDVNGNINLNGQLKINGDSGTARKVLMKDAGNNLVWGDLSEFKNLVIFDCTGIAVTTGSGNCSPIWSVPAGVTTILVECWGGGGGGGNFTGGGGGGYVSAKLTVTPLSTPGLTVGAGGNYSTTGSADGIQGGNTSFVIGGVSLTAGGGFGGNRFDVFTAASAAISQALGGTFATTGISSQYIGFNGSPGGISKLSYAQVSATEYGKLINYGDGGDAALLPGSGSKGGYKISSTSLTHSLYATQYGIQPGGGGGADATGGFYGRGGRIIIHW